jgi:hypothetical protein
MTINELLQSPIVKLPKVQADFNYRKFLFSVLDDFFTELKNIDFTGVTSISPLSDIDRTENLIEGIKKSVEFYLNGQPFNAYEELKKAFDYSSIFSLLINDGIMPGMNFYRLRANEENYSLPQKELFHIPFHKRGNVATQRYSIPGFPCLYMSNSIYVAWEELGRKPVEKIQAARLTNVSEIKYLDLVTDIYTGRPEFLANKTIDELWSSLLVWPLIAACSIKVFDRSASFKPEYIAPQLLLQIVRNEQNLDGIRFSSTHVNLNESLAEGRFYNYAIPVKIGKDENYCDSLKQKFEMTEVVPWQLLEVFSKINVGTATMGSPHPARDNVKFIELIKGRKLPYQFSPFGNLERTLDNYTPQPITF